MDWNCTLSEARLSDYLEGLSPADEAAAFRTHLADCPHCAALIAEVESALNLMRTAPPVEVPAHLIRNIIAATSGDADAAHGWRRWFPFAPVFWQPRFAMGAFTVAASFLIVFHAAVVSRNATGIAALNPATLARVADRQAHLAYAHTAKFVSDTRLVYEIESRLAPEEPDQPEQQPAPPSQPLQSQPKTQAVPRSSVRGRHTAVLYASAVLDAFPMSETRSER